MQTEISGNVLSVTGRQTKNGNTVFDVTIGTQKVSTFKDAVANKAKSLEGQNVKATVGVTQNGQYTNYTLLDLEPAGVVSPTPTVPSVVTGTVTTTTNGIPVQPQETDKERTESIVRQTCIKAAGHAFSAGHSAEEVLEIAEKFYRFVTGAKQPEQVAAGVAGGPDVPGDAIPWL